MSITFVYRDENNKVQVKKIEYEEVKKDLMKYMMILKKIHNRNH